MGSEYYQRRMDRRSAMYGVYSEKIRKIGIIREQDSVSIILKMKSNVFKGNIFHSLQLSISFEGKGICGMNGRFDKIGIWRVGICWFMEMRFWIYWFIETVCFGIQLCFVIGFQSVNYGFDVTMEYLPNIRLAKWNSYKRMMGVFSILHHAFKGLCFETTIDFKGGEFYASEEALVSLRYEKFFGFCDFCSSLCHKDEKCPLDPKNIKTSPEKSREMREGNGGWHEVGKHDERSWSYKGVVINGNINQPNRERERVELILGRGRAKWLTIMITNG
ncbi:unnamed protein product [Brassica oleracea]